MRDDPERHPVPALALTLDEKALARDAEAVLIELECGSPPVYFEPGEVGSATLVVNPLCLKEGEPEILAGRIKDVLRR